MQENGRIVEHYTIGSSNIFIDIIYNFFICFIMKSYLSQSQLIIVIRIITS